MKNITNIPTQVPAKALSDLLLWEVAIGVWSDFFGLLGDILGFLGDFLDFFGLRSSE